MAMLTDFILLTAAAVFFFFAIAGVGFRMAPIFGSSHMPVAFRYAAGYFLSLCTFTLFAVFGLFLFPDKLFTLEYFTWLYFSVSFAFILREVLPDWLSIGRKGIVAALRRQSIFVLTLVIALIPFFLQVYETSILDEWLHRPVVKSFLLNGVFPLVNPLSPDTNFILTYHYGVHIIGSAIALFSGLDTSPALDIFKLANVFATILLGFGLLRAWGAGRWYALIGAIIALYLGSSFFLADSFTTSHIKKVFDLPAQWPSNAPLSYGLSGITGVAAPLAAAMFVLAINFLSQKSSFLAAYALWGLVFGGMFLLSEYVAVMLVVSIFLFAVFLIFRGSARPTPVLVGALLFLATCGVSVYYSGGIGKALLNSGVGYLNGQQPGRSSSANVDDTVQSTEGASGVDVTAASVTREGEAIFRIRGPKEWGFPSEKRIIPVYGNLPYYVRTFLLETIAVALLITLAVMRKGQMSAQDLALATFGTLLIIFPFLISSSFGDLNIAKSLPIGLFILHLLIIRAVTVFKWPKIVLAGMATLFIFGVLPGLAIGSNIQWRWISSKGKSQYCSQNPKCYTGELTELLREFDQERPGLKRIVSDSKSVGKIADLTRAHVYSYGEAVIDGRLAQFGAIYVVYTPELERALTESDRKRIGRETLLLRRGGNAIIFVE